MNATVHDATRAPAPQRPHRPRQPHRLLDAIIARLALKNDAALGRLLALAPARISKIRHGQLTVSADVLLRLHETLDIPVRELKQLLDET